MPEQQDVIARCAKAMFALDMPSRNPNEPCFASSGKPGWTLYVNKVRAILQELRTPNEEMIEAANDALDEHFDPEDIPVGFEAISIFEAVIDRVLNQSGSGER